MTTCYRMINKPIILLILITATALTFSGCQTMPAEPAAVSPQLTTIESVQWAEHSESEPVDVNEAVKNIAQALAEPNDNDALTRVPLTLEQVRAAALRHNLDLKVQCINPELAQLDIDSERAAFEAVFHASSAYTYSEPCDVDDPVTHYWRNEVGVTQPLATGGSLALTMPFYDYELDPGTGVSEATASVSYVQSLFRGAGTQVNTAYIRIAEHQRNQVTAATKQDVIDVLAYADKIYWSYFAACKNLDIRKEQYNLAQKQLDQARKKVAAGAAAGIEIVRAEAGLSSRLENVITAQSSVQSAARQLQRVMNRPDLTLDKTLTFEPQTHPAPQGLTLNPESLVQQALDQRMDCVEMDESLRIQELRVDLARNQTKPKVNFNYSYTHAGSGNQLGDAWHEWTAQSGQDHYVGLYAEIPLGNRAAQTNLRRARLTQLQLEASQTRQEQTIHKEVIDALNNLERDWKRILAAQQSLASAARDYAVDQKQFELGARTSTDVLYSVSRLADAQLSRLYAFTDYEISQIELARVTGVLLGKDRIQWDAQNQEGEKFVTF